MASTPMDVDPPHGSSPATGSVHGTATPSTSLQVTRTLNQSLPATSAVTDTIAQYRPNKLFVRDSTDKGRSQPAHIISLDYDDPGELLMTSESDETIQIYKVREGRHDKQLLSQKYGVKLARFTHHSSAIVYASTKINDSLRFLTTHDNTFIRYFEGHEAPVTSLEVHPGNDELISCSKDNTVRLWDAETKTAIGILHLNEPYLAAFDPSGAVFAVACPASGAILLYDHRQFDRAPFLEIDVASTVSSIDRSHALQGWTKLSFSNDGRWLLLATNGEGHFLFNAMTGAFKAFLRKPDAGCERLAPGEDVLANAHSNGNPARCSNVEGSGDCCFTPDGRFVVGGSTTSVVVWDVLGKSADNRHMEPLHVLDNEKRKTAVVAFNPRFNFFATADRELSFWVPDADA